jgi:pilus assembly protein Flp/PilA
VSPSGRALQALGEIRADTDIGTLQEQRAMKHLILKFWRDETGTAAVEYGLVAAMVSVPLIFAGKAVASAISATFNQITEAMDRRP